MATQTQTWQDLAKSKRDSIFNSISNEWRLKSIPPAEEQRDVTGKYIHQFLSVREVEITETDAVDIVKQTSTGQWTAEEVIKAFCHRASLAHQLVILLQFETFGLIADSQGRPIAYMRHSSMQLFKALKSSINTMRSIKLPLGRCMAYPSV